MTSATQHTKYFQIIDNVLFLALCGLSGVFMYGVLDKFFSGKTNFSQSEESIMELPTITICFSNHNSSIKKYEYGSDFKIEYKILRRDFSNKSILLNEEENVTLFDEIIYLEKIITKDYGNCFRLTSVLTNNYMLKQETYIIIYFNDSIPEEDLPTSSDIFITSEKNSYGVVFSDWMNGKVMKHQINKGIANGIDLKADKYIYLTTNSKCSYDSFYECLSRLITEDLKELSSKCSIVSLPGLQVCKINKTKEEEDIFLSLLGNYYSQCLSTVNKLCVTSEYSGDEAYKAKLEDKSIFFQFIYRIPSNSATLYEEYLVYDEINAIGSIGGTLGMCIGFSFSGLISSLINILQRTLINIKGKLASQKSMKSESSNGLFENKNEFMIKSKQSITLEHMEGYSTNEIYLDKNLYCQLIEQLAKTDEKVAKLENWKTHIESMDILRR